MKNKQPVSDDMRERIKTDIGNLHRFLRWKKSDETIEKLMGTPSHEIVSSFLVEKNNPKDGTSDQMDIDLESGNVDTILLSSTKIILKLQEMQNKRFQHGTPMKVPPDELDLFKCLRRILVALAEKVSPEKLVDNEETITECINTILDTNRTYNTFRGTFPQIKPQTDTQNTSTS